MKRFILAVILALAANVAGATDFADGSTHTTDATPTQATGSNMPWTPQDGASFAVTMTAVARQTNGTGRASFKQFAIISSDGGVVTAAGVGTQEKAANAGAAAWTLAASIVNNQVVLTFTGEAGKTIDCNIVLSGIQVGPF